MINKTIIQKITLISGDIFALFLSLVFAKMVLGLLRDNDVIIFTTFGFAKLFGLTIIMVFWYQEQYSKRRPIWEELRMQFISIFIFALAHLMLNFLVSHHVIKLLFVIFWTQLFLLIPLIRFIIKYILTKLSLWQRNVFIIGSGELATSTAELLRANHILGYNIVGFVEFESHLDDKYSFDYILNEYKDEDLTEIVIAVSSDELYHNTDKINQLQSKFSFVSIVPDLVGLPLYGVELDHFFGNEQLFLRLQNNLGRRFNRVIKRMVDIILSLLGLIVLSPVLIIIALLIKLTTGSKILFFHTRIGYEGEEFGCIKFQTMYPNSKQILDELLASNPALKFEWERDFKLKNDPRVTKIGRFLRSTSLDEIPQLFNVLKGEMSLVGPRPIITAEIERYNDKFYYYKMVKPGITGLWQISGRSDIDYTNRVRLDVWYVKNWSLWYDLVIIFKTMFVVLKRNGAY